MRMAIVPTVTMPGVQTHVPEIKEKPGRDRDHDADDKAVTLQPAPKGLGHIVNSNA